MKFFWGITAVLLTVTVAGCAPRSMSGDVYSRERAQRVQTIEYGEVIEVRQVLIEGTKSGVGTLAGGALGGALGSGIGRGAGSTIGVVGGAIVGGFAGSAVEEAAKAEAPPPDEGEEPPSGGADTGDEDFIDVDAEDA